MSMDGLRVVVANDDPVTLTTISRLLEKMGCVVFSYDDGESALRALLQGMVCDLVIVDLYMPGIDGWQFCRLVRSAESIDVAGLPVLVVSATFKGAEVEAITSATGANAFLSVPFTPEALRGYVKEIVGGHRPHRQRRAMVFSMDEEWSGGIASGLERAGYAVSQPDAAVATELEAADLAVWDDRSPSQDLFPLLRLSEARQMGVMWIVLTEDMAVRNRMEYLARGTDLVLPRLIQPELLPDLARSVGRERALVRVEEVLDARTVALQTAEERYRGLFEAVPGPVLVADRDLLVTEVNRAAADLLAPSGGDLRSVSLLNLMLGPESRLLNLVRDATLGTEPVRGEIRLRDLSGAEQHLSLSILHLTRPAAHFMIVATPILRAVEGTPGAAPTSDPLALLTDHQTSSTTLDLNESVSAEPDRGASDRPLVEEPRVLSSGAPPNKECEPTVPISPDTSPVGRGTVLVVDDEPTIRSLVGRILKRQGFTVAEAGNGLSGVEAFRQQHGNLSAVLLDRTMPQLGGDEAMEQMRAINPHVPIILSSGDMDEENPAEGAERAADALIAKPYGPADLVAVVLGVLGDPVSTPVKAATSTP